MIKHPFVYFCLVLGLVTSFAVGAVGAQKKQDSACSAPPEFVSKRPLPKAEQERAKKLKPQGSVSIVVNAAGEVVDAKVAHADSDEAGKLMVNLAKGMVFKPRPSCGLIKTIVNFGPNK